MAGSEVSLPFFGPYRFLPLALVMVAVTRLHLTIVAFASIPKWLPLLWLAGVAAIAASVAAAVTADRRRVR